MKGRQSSDLSPLHFAYYPASVQVTQIYPNELFDVLHPYTVVIWGQRMEFPACLSLVFLQLTGLNLKIIPLKQSFLTMAGH